MWITVCCIHRSQTSGVSLCLLATLNTRHRATETSQNKDISAVEITEVMLRSVLSSIGQMKNNNPYLSESSYCRLIHHHGPLKEDVRTMKTLKSLCTAALSSVVELFLFACHFTGFTCTSATQYQVVSAFFSQTIPAF